MRKLFMLFIFALLLKSYSMAINKIRVALFDVRAVNTSQVYADKFYSELRNALVKSKKMIVVTGSKKELIMKIEEWKKSGCTEVECIANAGGELGVDKVISAELREMPGGYYEVDIMVVDVLSQEIEFIIQSLKEEKVSKFNELAQRAVDAIESKIIIQPIIIAVGENNVVFLDAGADFGIVKGMKFKIERWSNVQTDERGKIVYVDKQEIGEIEIVDVQSSGSKGIILRQNKPIGKGDKAVFAGEMAEKIDEPPAVFHTPVQTYLKGKDIEISANIIDDIQVVKAFVLYRNKGETSYKAVEMKRVQKDKFLAQIPASEIQSNYLEYLIKAVDSKGQETIKSDINDKPFLISILPDNVPPEISHVPLTKININERTFIRCNVKDNVGVAKVIVGYKMSSDLNYSYIELTYQGGTAYAGELTLPHQPNLNQTTLYYFIIARDLAGNAATFGSEANPYKATIEYIDIVGPTIIHVPVKSFKSGENIKITAEVKDESGVDEVSIFYKDEYSPKFTKLLLNAIAPGRFSAEISTLNMPNTKLYYYISARDKYGNISYLPSPETPFVIIPTVLTLPLTSAKSDNTPPFAVHFPSVYYKSGLGYPVTVLSDDETGISSCIIYYKGRGDTRFKSRYLRNFGYQSYGEYIQASPDEFAYYIVITDVNQNTTMIASPSKPIVVGGGEIISGDWQYVIGSWPKVPNPSIQLIYPFKAILKGDAEFEKEFNFTFKESSPYIKIEGIVASYRELKAVLVNSEPAQISVPNSYDVSIAKIKGPLYKFVSEVPLLNKYNEVIVEAVDTQGLRSRIILKINRISEIVYTGLKPEIKIVSPYVLSQSDSISVTASTSIVRIVGLVNSEVKVKSVTVNNQQIPFLDLTSEEKINYNVRRNSVKFLYEQKLAGGLNVINIVVSDDFNNTAMKTLKVFAPTQLVIVDTLPPLITFVSPAEKQIESDYAFVKITVDDDNKLESVKILVRDIGVEPWKIKQITPKSILYEDTLKLIRGLNKVTVIAYDGVNTATKTFEIFNIPKRRPPRIIVLSPMDTISEQNAVTLHLIVEDDFITPNVMVVVNDQIVRGIGLKSKKANSIEFEQRVALNKGINLIRIIAYNESVDTSVILKINYTERVISTPYFDFYKNSWAVLVGINEYQKLPKLKYAVRDAKGFKEVLVEYLGFEPSKIIEIYDKNATKQNILKILGDDLPKKVSSEDRVVIFFAGHGITESLPAGGEMGYLVPFDGDPEAKYTTCISMTEINNFARLSPAKHMLFIVDACYGGLAGWLAPRGVPLPEQTIEYVKKKVKERGRQLLAAGQKDEQVYESELWGHSVFTYYLIKALQGGADVNNDRVITVTELFNYLEPRVSNETQFKQTPLLRTLPSEGDGEFVFIIEK